MNRYLGSIFLCSALALATTGCPAPLDVPAVDMTKAQAAPDMAVPFVADMAHAQPDLSVVGVCDTFLQDCAGMNNKCTVVSDINNMLSTHCEPVTGSGGPDAPCMRSTDGGVPGFDDCQKGSFCSSTGSINADLTARHCCAFCSMDSDCKTAGDKCFALTDADGICAPGCTPFDSTTCPMGFECSVFQADLDGQNIFATCRSVGAVAAGVACVATTDCVTNTLCTDPTNMNKPVCTPMCDKTHACAAGKTCQTAQGLANGAGICG